MESSKAKLAHRIIIAFYLLSCAVSAVYTLATGGGRIYFCLFAPVLLLVPVVIERVFRLKRNYVINSLMYTHFFFAFVVGSALEVYEKLPGYDNIVHGCFGVLFAYIGVYVYDLLGGGKDEIIVDAKKTTKEFARSLCFGIFFTMALGCFWEFYEYFYDTLTGADSQWVAATGIGDTMQDSLANTIGALLMALVLILIRRRTGKTKKTA